MKFLFFIFLSTFHIHAHNLSSFRKLYSEAANDKNKAQLLLIETGKHRLQNIIACGYYGAGKMIMARYYLNPFLKLNTFNEGKKILEASIKNDTAVVELRFLRLTIQINTPSFLGYNSDIKKDKLFLFQSVASINDQQLKTIIYNYLKTI